MKNVVSIPCKFIGIFEYGKYSKGNLIEVSKPISFDIDGFGLFEVSHKIMKTKKYTYICFCGEVNLFTHEVFRFLNDDFDKIPKTIFKPLVHTTIYNLFSDIRKFKFNENKTFFTNEI